MKPTTTSASPQPPKISRRKEEVFGIKRERITTNEHSRAETFNENFLNMEQNGTNGYENSNNSNQNNYHNNNRPEQQQQKKREEDAEITR